MSQSADPLSPMDRQPVPPPARSAADAETIDVCGGRIAAPPRRAAESERSHRTAETVVGTPRVAEAARAARLAETVRAIDALAMRSTMHALPATTTESEVPAPDALVGGRLGQYEVVREIGRGGMGTVYLARDLRLGRLVAIKRLSGVGAADNARFLAEARVTARCNHENIVVIHDVGEHDGQPYMVFEYVAGQTLRAWLDERAPRGEGPPPIEPGLAASLMVPVVRALAYAHDMGIVHRDLKPANIMLTDAGAIKVLDFGIATLVAGADAAMAFHAAPDAEPGAIIGTLPYMSPEQLDGDAVDHRTDLWAVGIMLYQMVTGVHPVIRDGNLQRALLDIAALDVAMPSVAEHRSDLGALAAITDRCLIKDRAHRTRDAHVLLEELAAVAAGERVTAQRHDGNPFAGLAAFQEADADRFYGRAREAGAVLARLRRCPLVVLAGPSGVGKSSLVRAGAVPLLKRSGEGWDAFVVRPGRSPLAALSAMLLDLSSAASDPMVAPLGGEPAADLRAAPGQLGAALRAWAHRKRRRVLVFVDQFEELYTLCPAPDERAAFLACLDSVADDAGSPLRVIASIRSDFLDRLAEHRQLADRIAAGLMLVPPLDRDGLRDALIRPVEAADYRYEDPAILDEMLAAVAAAPSSLPLLQFAAARLWTERDRGRRVLTRASYDAMGGIAGTLAGHADQVLGALPAPELSLARAIFERLVTPERTRAVVGLGELRELPGDPDDIERLIHRLVDARLLVVESRAGDDRVVELVHESLIARWPTLVGWLDDNREDAAFLARLRTAAAQWHAGYRDEGMLWRGEPARRALAWQSHYRGELGRREFAYLDAVRDATERTEQRRRWIRRRVIAAAIAVPMILLAMASVALVEISRAERAARENAAELREKSDNLQRALRDLSDASRRADDERDRALRQQAVAEQAAHDAKAAKERAEQSAREAEREKAHAERAADEAKSEKAKADEAARQADEARKKAAEAAEAARKSEQEKKAIIDRAVGPIETRL